MRGGIGVIGQSVLQWGQRDEEEIIMAGFNSGFKATMSAAQDIPATAWTKLVFDTEVFDNGNEYDNAINYRFTVTNTGIYWAGLSVYLNEPLADNKFINLGICKNANPVGGGLILAALEHAYGAKQWTVDVGGLINMSASDWIEAYIYIDHTEAREVSHARAHTHFSAHRIK
jgi:hypothetical protein